LHFRKMKTAYDERDVNLTREVETVSERSKNMEGTVIGRIKMVK